MAVKLTTEQELQKQLKVGYIRPCYLFYGKDIASLESAVRQLVSKIMPDDARDLNYHFFAGSEFDVSEFADVCASLPMFADRVVAAVNDLNADTIKTDDMKFLKKTISEIDPDTITAIFYATGIDLCGGKKSLSEKNQKFAELIEKSGGCVVEFAYKRPQELVKYIRERVEQNGAEISQNAALSLAESCLCNILMINNEIEKLTAYCSAGKITESDVRELVAGQLDTDAYKLARAVTSGDRESVFPILSELYSRQQESVPLLSVIGGAFLDLYRAKLAQISGRADKDIAADFSYRGREFAIRNALRDCSKVSLEKLRYCLRVLSECDIGMKSKRTEQRILLEEAIIKMMNY